MQVPAVLAPVVDLLFPPRCPLCGAGTAAQTGLCADCWSDLAIPGQPACKLCQRPFGDGGIEQGVCAPCMAHPPRHAGIAAGTLYNDASRRLVLAFKYGRRIALAPMLARLIAAQLPHDGEEWTLVPVPLHRWRLWQRGYNQSALLAREIGRIREMPVVIDGLVRKRATPTLAGLGQTARISAVQGAIAVNPRRSSLLAGRNVVLVDDVLTSGATSGACVAALRKAGVKAVRIACFARVLDEALDRLPASLPEWGDDTKTPGTEFRASS